MMLEGLGPPLQKALKNVVGLEVSREGRYATGLCRLDVFDWFSYFEEMIAAKEPDLVIITIGANDTQDIVDENGRHLVTTDSWREIYGQRVKTLLAIAAQSKVEVAWIGLPIMGQETYNQRTIAINEVAAQACAEASNCRFFDSWDILADKGQYSTFLTINQKRQRVRAKDLIHLTEAGGRILAEAFLNDTQSWAILGQDPNSPLAESDLPAAPVVLNPNAPPIRLVSAPIPIDGPNPPENRTIIDDPALVPNKLVPPAPVIFGPSQIDNLKADNLTKVAPTGSHNLTTNPNPLANLTINPPPMVYPDPKEAAALVEATLESRLLGRTVNYLVYTPKTQGPLPAVLLLPGVGENYKAFVSHFGEDLFKQAIANGLILIMIDSGEDGWYLDSPILKRSKYQSHILDELIPDALEKFPIQKEKLAISGISMGGHGALTLALKSPTRFQAVSSFSGVTDLTVHGDNHPINRFLGLEKVLGPYKRHTARWRESSAYWVTKDDPAALKGLGVFLTVGLSDKLTLAENRQYDRLLTELAIPHLYREDSGGHDWPLWLRELPDHLAFLAGYLR
jgi:S-formylglutathione hydrolase FrmB/lysophospholipase L1-like esterase